MRDVRQLQRLCAALAELALASVGFVVLVRQPMLVQCDSSRRRFEERVQTSRTVIGDCFRNRCYIEWHVALTKHINQLKQSRVIPTRIVIAKEEDDGLRRQIQRLS